MEHREIILEVISKLREKELSYSKIGFKLGLHRSAVYMIEKDTWYPKMPEVEKRIIDNIKELGL